MRRGLLEPHVCNIRMHNSYWGNERNRFRFILCYHVDWQRYESGPFAGKRNKC
jgi:hypothetical protein